jgi:hypothetical protein
MDFRLSRPHTHSPAGALRRGQETQAQLGEPSVVDVRLIIKDVRMLDAFFRTDGDSGKIEAD